MTHMHTTHTHIHIPKMHAYTTHMNTHVFNTHAYNIHMYTHMHTPSYNTHVYTHAHNTHMHAAYTCIHTCVHICMQHIYMYIHMHTTHICIHATYVYMHIWHTLMCIHTHTLKPISQSINLYIPRIRTQSGKCLRGEWVQPFPFLSLPLPFGRDSVLCGSHTSVLWKLYWSFGSFPKAPRRFHELCMPLSTDCESKNGSFHRGTGWG